MEYSNADNYKVVLFGITGGTGSLIARSLLARGHKVAGKAADVNGSFAFLRVRLRSVRKWSFGCDG